jgi:spoIIIJ-associated protein
MEWVETTGKSLDEAKEQALDRLGIGPDDAEFEILEEPRVGLFGRTRGEARVRARVKPATVRPKQDRRTRRKDSGRDRGSRSGGAERTSDSAPVDAEAVTAGVASGADVAGAEQAAAAGPRGQRRQKSGSAAASSNTNPRGDAMSDDHISTSDDATDTAAPSAPAVDVAQVQQAAEEFATGLLAAFGVTGTASSSSEGTEIEVRIDGQGDGLGLLIGPGGRTLLAIQDLARVAAQRRLGDHETRLRVDVAGYREKRKAALERFAEHVAGLVKESGTARSLDPMPSADRKVIHDTLAGIEGVTTRSEGEDPYRRIIVAPA